MLDHTTSRILTRTAKAVVASLLLAATSACTPFPCSEEVGAPMQADQLDSPGLALRLSFVTEDGLRCSEALSQDGEFDHDVEAGFEGELFDLPRPAAARAWSGISFGQSIPARAPLEDESGVIEVDFLQIVQVYDRATRWGPTHSGFRAGGVRDGIEIEFVPELDSDGTLAGHLVAPVALGEAFGEDMEGVDVVVESLAFRGVPVRPPE